MGFPDEVDRVAQSGAGGVSTTPGERTDVTEPVPLPESLWAATAAPPPPTPPLVGEQHADVAVIGGGYTGLSAGLYLAEAGADVAVLEAAEPGWGASGRNNGQINPSHRLDPDGIEARFGGEMGRRVVEAFAGSADLVFELIERHAIACDAVRTGWLQLAPDARSMKANVVLAEQWQRRGVAVQVLDGGETARRVGSRAYVGAMLDPRCGGLQPLGYARGLARAALGAGAAIHGGSPALSLKREAEGWRVATPDGAVVAETVILATNGYTDHLWPGLRRTIIPVNTFQAATEPLGENLRRSILPGGEVVTENRSVGFHYYRIDAGGRLIMGGRATFTEADRPHLYRVLHEVVPKLFPQLAKARWQYRWAGKLALTRDYMPHLHEHEPGVLMALGYNGRGVAPATLMGKLLAERALGAPQDNIPFPFSPVRPLPLHGLHPPVLYIMLQIKRLREVLGF